LLFPTAIVAAAAAFVVAAANGETDLFFSELRKEASPPFLGETSFSPASASAASAGTGGEF